MSQRLTPNQLAALLERVRTRGGSEEADKLSQHLDSLGDSALVDHLAASSAAQTRTALAIERMEPIYARAVDLLSASVELERNRLALDQRTLDRQDKDRAAALEDSKEARTLRYQHLVAPILTILGSLVAAYIGSGGSLPAAGP